MSRNASFCAVQSREDREGLIVRRSDLAFAVLNLYPYSPGHLLICPYRHVADLTELAHDELCALGELTQDAMRVVRAASAPHGFNLGTQTARRAAEFAAHPHQHGAALGGRRQLPSGHRADEGTAAATGPDLGDRTRQLGRLCRLGR